MNRSEPFFSIVVPTYNRPDRLKECLQALAGLDYPDAALEVIIVDDGGTIPLGPVVSSVKVQFDVTLIQQRNTGPAGARNLGAKHARGKYLAFTDDDCAPQRDWVEKLENYFEVVPDALIGGRTVNALTGNIFSCASQDLVEYLYLHYDKKGGRGTPFFTSNNMALSSRDFHEVGGFSTRFPRAAAEDREFCYRWLQGARPMIYAKDAVVAHSHAMDFSSFFKQHFFYGRGAFLYHQIRLEQGQRGIQPEPLSFYLNMLKIPFLQKGSAFQWVKAMLLGLTQGANLAGFCWEYMRQVYLNRTS